MDIPLKLVGVVSVKIVAAIGAKNPTKNPNNPRIKIRE